MLLHYEGTKVNKNDPELLNTLENFYDVIRQYDQENVYNMDETRSFFRFLPRYALLIPYEDLSSTRGKKIKQNIVFLLLFVLMLLVGIRFHAL